MDADLPHSVLSAHAATRDEHGLHSEAITEAREIIKDIECQCAEILLVKGEALDRLTAELLEHETVSGEIVNECLVCGEMPACFFMLKSSSEAHIGQRKLLVEELRASEGPMLLGGDFNVGRHELLVRQFAGAGYRAVQTDEVTWRRRPYVLDHIFYSRHLRPVRYAVQPTPASDHHILAAEFEFTD